MVQALSIKRKKGSDDPGSYESLRRAGIELAQQFSGNVWTDYNLHDPGVTILEQLCYALTDLIYRADLDVAAYLTRPDGTIDFEQLALHHPSAIFPCRPTTSADYRKALLDGVVELDNLWITAMAPQERGAVGCRGLYRILLKLDDECEQSDATAVIDKVRRLYGELRNLGEDVAVIAVATTEACELHAEIEVTGARPAADLLAEIYFYCSQRMVGGGGGVSYDRALAEGEPLEHVFEGPLTQRGWYREASVNEPSGEISLAALFAVVKSIEGVDHIRRLCLEKAGHLHYESLVPTSDAAVLTLLVPRRAAQVRVELLHNGRKIEVAIDDLRSKFDELNFTHHSASYGRQGLEQLCALPRGNAVPLRDYYSVLNSFPVVYGVGPQGISSSAPPEVGASVRQLQACLQIFDQIMANYLANLDSVKELFSCGNHPPRSYHDQRLEEPAIVGFERIQQSCDNYYDRKSRLLDYLLALYGETLAPELWQHEHYYSDPSRVAEAVVARKLSYLKAVVTLGRDRAAAFDYHRPVDQSVNVSGLQHRVCLQLGFVQPPGASLTSAILQQETQLLPHARYLQQRVESDAPRLLEMATLEAARRAALVALPELALALQLGLHTVPVSSSASRLLHNTLLSEQVLREGIVIDNYRVERVNDGEEYALWLQIDAQYCWYLGVYNDATATVQAALALRHRFLQLNRESEGLHLVEHILLRPGGNVWRETIGLPAEEDFYSCRVSLLFPAWSTRCYDTSFRVVAEETVALNLPAHLYAEFYWLEFQTMCEFEILHQNWLQLQQHEERSEQALDDAAVAMVRFLHENRPSSQHSVVRSHVNRG